MRRPKWGKSGGNVFEEKGNSAPSAAKIQMMNRFHFRGFTPAPELEVFAARALGQLLDRAPGDSSALGSVEYLLEGYLARLDVYSKQGPFLADAMAASPQEALDQVFEKIQDQLTQWRNHRANGTEHTVPWDYYLQHREVGAKR